MFVRIGNNSPNDFSGRSGENNLLDGRGANDTLRGAQLADTLLGGDQDDILEGRDGDDLLDGGRDNDTLLGGGGNDVLLGGANQGADSIDGGEGNDTVDGGAGEDLVIGGAEQDTLRGGEDNDTLLGGGGDDSLLGNEGDDLIRGGAGANTIEGGAGNDTIIGGDDGDTVVWASGDGNDTITFGSGPNTLFLEGFDGVNSGTDDWLVELPAGPAPGGASFFHIPTGSTVIVTDWKNGQDKVICFYPGTLVATPTGERPVESLQAGDLVLTKDGAARPVRWMGRQTVSTRFGDPLTVLPIRIRAGALAEGLPKRDLLVSPQHALLVEGVLVQAGALVNGTSITREPAVPEVFTYWHVELGTHELILAEGVPAETFVDTVDRGHFDNWEERAALPDADSTIPEMDLPRAKSHRQVPARIRAVLAERAGLSAGRVAA